MYCIKVEKKNAQEVKELVLKKNILDKDYKIVTDSNFIYFPLIEKLEGYEYIEKKLPKIERINIELSSFDQIGDIIIVQEGTSKDTAEKILKKSKCKVVLMKTGIHKGEFRTQDLVYLAGEKRKETIYKESGVNIKLNVETSYFSPRLSNERLRIASLVKEKERVLVLFSGVGPYPLIIAKHANPTEIVAVEKNTQAHQYAIFNCRNVKTITCLNLDAKNYKSEKNFDRVIMPLPKSAKDFLDLALSVCKPKGTVHFYDFAHENEIPNTSLEKIRKHAPNFNHLSINICGKYAPGKFRICIDFMPEAGQQNTNL
jgi:tRNA (guanine37-N1)-methyltransferase